MNHKSDYVGADGERRRDSLVSGMLYSHSLADKMLLRPSALDLNTNGNFTLNTNIMLLL